MAVNQLSKENTIVMTFENPMLRQAPIMKKAKLIGSSYMGFAIKWDILAHWYCGEWAEESMDNAHSAYP